MGVFACMVMRHEVFDFYNLLVILNLKQKILNFALPLPNSIMVVQKILDLLVLVRIQVGQRKSPGKYPGLFLFKPFLMV